MLLNPECRRCLIDHQLNIVVNNTDESSLSIQDFSEPLKESRLKFVNLRALSLLSGVNRRYKNYIIRRLSRHRLHVVAKEEKGMLNITVTLYYYYKQNYTITFDFIILENSYVILDGGYEKLIDSYNNLQSLYMANIFHSNVNTLQIFYKSILPQWMFNDFYGKFSNLLQFS